MFEMHTDPEVVITAQNWQQLLEWKANYPNTINKWLRLLTRVVIHSAPPEDDLIGSLIVPFIGSSLQDINDLMTLTSHDSHYGAQKILRPFYERVVTLKYIAANPNEAERFMGFDAIDWEQVLIAIAEQSGMQISEPARTNLKNAVAKGRTDYKQAKCSECGLRKQTSWSTLSSNAMSTRVDMGHMHLHAFVIPSKLIHPTYWGMREVVSDNSPMLNTLKCMHELIVQLVLIHRRHFVGAKALTPIMKEAVTDFLKIWTFAETSFGGVLWAYEPGIFIPHKASSVG
jgi:hypothetical protein